MRLLEEVCLVCWLVWGGRFSPPLNTPLLLGRFDHVSCEVRGNGWVCLWALAGQERFSRPWQVTSCIAGLTVTL